MSAARNSYLDLFLALAPMMFLVKGMVSSTSVTVGGFVELSIVTRSGLCAVITIVGGTVPPLTLAPSRSAYICILSGFLSDSSWYKYESTPLCLHSYLSNMFGQLFRMCPNVAVVLMFGLALDTGASFTFLCM